MFWRLLCSLLCLSVRHFNTFHVILWFSKMCYPFFCGSFGNPFLLTERWRADLLLDAFETPPLAEGSGGVMNPQAKMICTRSQPRKLPWYQNKWHHSFSRVRWCLQKGLTISKKFIILPHNTNTFPFFINQQWVHGSEKIIVGQKLNSFKWNMLKTFIR